jgi:hypothetical protein
MSEPVHLQTPGSGDSHRRGGRGGHSHGVSPGADKRHRHAIVAVLCAASSRSAGAKLVERARQGAVVILDVPAEPGS